MMYNTGIDYTFSSSDGDHKHVIDSQKVAKHVVSVAFKSKAQEDVTLRSNKMIDAELKGDPDHLNVLTKKDTVYIRSEQKFVLSCQSIVEVFIQLMMYEVTTASNENFLYHLYSTKHIVIFTCQTNIEVLQ